jgi:hypothetical protein
MFPIFQKYTVGIRNTHNAAMCFPSVPSHVDQQVVDIVAKWVRKIAARTT